MPRIGFVGAGTLTEAVVTGLQQTHAGRCRIHLSPRSEAISHQLAVKYANVERLESNAAVVDSSDVVMLAMRPQQLSSAVERLPFRSEQIVVSFVAGASLALVAPLIAPASTLVRVNPLPPVRFRKGPILIYPGNPVVEDLFGGLGDLIVGSKESDLIAIGNASALMSTHYEMQNVIVTWLMSRNMSPSNASLYVRSLFAGLAEIGLDAHRSGTTLDPAHHETKGGLNERGRAYMHEVGWFDEIERALGAIERHSVVKLVPAPLDRWRP